MRVVSNLGPSVLVEMSADEVAALAGHGKTPTEAMVAQQMLSDGVVESWFATNCPEIGIDNHFLTLSTAGGVVRGAG